MKNEKIDFWQKLPDTICVRKGEKTRIFARTICFGQNFLGPKTVKTRKHFKNSGFRGKCPKPKMTPLFDKGFFDIGEKVGFTTVFLKRCVLKTLFL